MHAHVNEKLVASVERLEASRAPLPETGEVFPFPLVDVHLLYVPDQFLLLLEEGVAVDPPADLLLHFQPQFGSGGGDRGTVGVGVDDGGRVVGTGLKVLGMVGWRRGHVGREGMGGHGWKLSWCQCILTRNGRVVVTLDWRVVVVVGWVGGMLSEGGILLVCLRIGVGLVLRERWTLLGKVLGSLRGMLRQGLWWVMMLWKLRWHLMGLFRPGLELSLWIFLPL